ncbi:MAG: hypothetical protein Q7R47_00615 [Candidatus Diapherotrites archaeon]|nr:hypothetical protein [Candidatus Diapherotrites archaeon]
MGTTERLFDSSQVLCDMKISPEKIQQLRTIAIAILEEKASLRREPHDYVRPLEAKHSKEKIAAVLSDLRTSKKTLHQIAKDRSIPFNSVRWLSWNLKQETGMKRRGVSERIPIKKSNGLTDAQIKKGLSNFERMIKVWSIRLASEPRVRQVESDPSVIEEKLIQELTRRLESFDLAKVKGPLGASIGAFIKVNMNWATREFRRTISRRGPAGYVRSLNAENPFGSTLAETLAAKDKSDKPSAIEIDKRLQSEGFFPSQRAMLLARMAGMNGRQIGAVLGLSDSSVSQYFKPMRNRRGLKTIRSRPRKRR